MKLLALRLVLLSGLLGLCAWASGSAHADFQWNQIPGPPQQRSMSKCTLATDCVTTTGCTNLNPPVSMSVEGVTVMVKSWHSRDKIDYGRCMADTAATCYQYPNVPCATVYAYTSLDCPSNAKAGIKMVYSGNCTPP